MQFNLTWSLILDLGNGLLQNSLFLLFSGYKKQGRCHGVNISCHVPFLFRSPISSWARCVNSMTTVTGVTSSTTAASRTCWGRSTQTAAKNRIRTPQRWAALLHTLCSQCHYSNTTNLNSCGEKLLESWSYLGGTCISVEAASSHRAVMDTLQGVWCGTVIVLVSKVNAGGFFLPCSRAAQWRSRSGIMWAAPWSSSSASTPEPRTCSPSFIASPTAARTTARAKCEGTVLQMTLMPKDDS